MQSRKVLRVAVVFLAVAMLPLGKVRGAEADPPPAATSVSPDDTLVYVGTYTGPKSKGIYLFKLQTENLDATQNIKLVPLGLAAEVKSPTFLEIDPQRRLLFAVTESNRFEGQPTGAVSARFRSIGRRGS